MAGPVHPERSRTERSHTAVAHTADVGVRATAPGPAGLLEEAALALAEIGADIADAQPMASAPLEVRGDDAVGLAYAWLNDLVGLADARGEALVGAEVESLTSDEDGWSARGTARFAPYDERVRPRLQVKAATFHRLAVTEEADGWSLEAYFDV